MTCIWLIAWLIWHTPKVLAWSDWNSWGISLFVCLAIDLLGIPRSSRRHSHRSS